MKTYLSLTTLLLLLALGVPLATAAAGDDRLTPLQWQTVDPAFLQVDTLAVPKGEGLLRLRFTFTVKEIVPDGDMLEVRIAPSERVQYSGERTWTVVAHKGETYTRDLEFVLPPNDSSEIVFGVWHGTHWITQPTTFFTSPGKTVALGPWFEGVWPEPVVPDSTLYEFVFRIQNDKLRVYLKDIVEPHSGVAKAGPDSGTYVLWLTHEQIRKLRREPGLQGRYATDSFNLLYPPPTR